MHICVNIALRSFGCLVASDEITFLGSYGFPLCGKNVTLYYITLR